MLEVFHPVTRWFEIYTIYTLFHIWSGLWSLFINSVTSFQLVLLSGMFQDWCPLINLFVLFLFVLWQQQKYDRKQASNDVVFLNGGEGEGWGVFQNQGFIWTERLFSYFHQLDVKVNAKTRLRCQVIWHLDIIFPAQSFLLSDLSALF